MSFIAGNFPQAYHGMDAIMGIVNRSLKSMALKPLMNGPSEPELRQTGRMEVVKRWLDAGTEWCCADHEAGETTLPQQNGLTDARWA